jgi:hypothetical protein
MPDETPTPRFTRKAPGTHAKRKRYRDKTLDSLSEACKKWGVLSTPANQHRLQRLRSIADEEWDLAA